MPLLSWVESFESKALKHNGGALAIFYAQVSKPALLFNNASVPVLPVPGRGGRGGSLGGVGWRGFEGSTGPSKVNLRVIERDLLPAVILSHGLSKPWASINWSEHVQGLKSNLLKWNKRLGWNHLYLAVSVGLWCLKSPHQENVVFTINSALQRRGHIGTGFSGVLYLSQFPSQWANGDYLTLWHWRMWLQITYPLMAFTRRGTQARKTATFSFVT